MTAPRPGEPSQQHSGRGHRFFPPLPKAPSWPWVPRDPAEVRLELLTLALSVPVAPSIIVVVTVHDMPTWWLIVAGVLIGWANDAVTTLFGHCMGLYIVRRAHSMPHPGDHTEAGNSPSPLSTTDPRHHDEGPPHIQRPQ